MEIYPPNFFSRCIARMPTRQIALDCRFAWKLVYSDIYWIASLSEFHPWYQERISCSVSKLCRIVPTKLFFTCQCSRNLGGCKIYMLTLQPLGIFGSIVQVAKLQSCNSFVLSRALVCPLKRRRKRKVRCEDRVKPERKQRRV